MVSSRKAVWLEQSVEGAWYQGGAEPDGLGGCCHHFGFDLGDRGPLEGFEESRDGL